MCNNTKAYVILQGFQYRNAICLQNGMTINADFTPNYDFSDENFVYLKDTLIQELKQDFLQRMEKARDKAFALEIEKEKLVSQQKRSMEVYGGILISEFESTYRTGLTPIREIIKDFVTFYTKTRENWVKSYEIHQIQNNQEFVKYGPEREFELLVLMATWAKENLGFNGQPIESNHCPVDITRTDALYYFEKLALYQAEREYAVYIQGFILADQSENILDRPVNVNREYTSARQILAYRHLLIEFGLNEAFVNKSDIVRFMHLLMAKEVTKISNSTIYDRMKKLNATEKRDNADYNFVIRHFERLNAPAGSGIDNIIKRLRKDME